MLGGRLGHRLSHLSRRLLRIGGGGGSAVAGGCRRGGCRRHLNRRCAHGLLAGSRAGIVRGGQQGRGVGRSALGRLCKEQAAGERQISGGGWRAEAVASGNARNALQTRLPDTFAWLGAAAAPHEHPSREQWLAGGARRRGGCSTLTKSIDQLHRGWRRACSGAQGRPPCRHSPFDPQQPIAHCPRRATGPTMRELNARRCLSHGACSCLLRLPPLATAGSKSARCNKAVTLGANTRNCTGSIQETGDENLMKGGPRRWLLYRPRLGTKKVVGAGRRQPPLAAAAIDRMPSPRRLPLQPAAAVLELTS